jgi:pectate lyase
LVFCNCLTHLFPQNKTLSFPGAEGSGRFAKGGRGGTVYEVTNLNNSGPGSLVDAVSQSYRTVVFRVSGTIELGDVILRPKSYVTIAGQTAPGDGICIKGRIYVNGNHIVIRYLRVRVDAGAANSSGDAIDIAGGKNIIIDHVSASYARDETISCQETSDSVTVQWCLMSEALTFEGHSYGSLVRGDKGDQKTYHHNLYAHCQGRLPRPGNYTQAVYDTLGLFFDFRNNVVYNWAGSAPGYNADTGSVSRYNFIGNVYIPGPESSTSSKMFKEDAYKAYAYFADNMLNGIVPTDQWSLFSWGGKFTTANKTAYQQRSYLIPMEPVTTTAPAQAYLDVLAQAGCSFPVRDTIDRRIIKNVINRTGHSIYNLSQQPEGGWPTLASLPAPDDDDHDGMPNAWELAHGLDPNNPADRNLIDQTGYTMLEIYLNSLVTEPANRLTASQWQPRTHLLVHSYPNPFNASTTIAINLPEPGLLSLKIYDVQGRLVRSYPGACYGPSSYQFVWLGNNDHGQPVASGIYLLSIKFNNTHKVLKMHLLR